MTPGHASKAKFLHHCILLFITFDLICNMTLYKMDLDPSGPHPHWPCPQGSHQNSECVPLVLIHRAITYDSFKVLAKKPKRSLVTIKKTPKQKKKPLKPTFWPLVTPRHASGAKFLHHCILLCVTFNLICNITVFLQNEFWTLRGQTPLALSQGVISKFRMCSSSPHP